MPDGSTPARPIQRRVLQAVVHLAARDPVALHALREHARDAGYPVSAPVLATLRAAGLATDAGIAAATRAIVAEGVRGHGLAVRVRGRAVPVGVASAAPGATLERAVVEAMRAGRPDAAARRVRLAARALATVAARRGRRVDARAMLRLTAAAATLVDAHGAAPPALQRALVALRRLLAPWWSPAAAALFYDLVAMVGARVDGAPALPLRRVPYWQKEAHPLGGFRSAPTLPRSADVVIVGAGLIGGSAALHLADAVRTQGLSVVLLDAGDVAAEATGRNGGNIEAIPENFFGAYGTYDGFVEERLKFLQAAYPQLPQGALRAQAERIATTIIRFAHANARLLTADVARHGFAVDLSTSGWLRLALNVREERALVREVAFARALGVAMRTIGPAEVRRRFGLETPFRARLADGNGNFHPFKFVVQEVRAAVARGVQLHTHTRVEALVVQGAHDYRLETARGAIRARKVILATNAFTRELVPSLADIQPFRSQVVNYHHVRNALRGITVTAHDGDIYGNFPRQDWHAHADGHRCGTLHLGGGLDTPIASPHGVAPTRAVYRLIRDGAERLFPDLRGRAPVRTWAGPMAFVEGAHGMRMPVIGELGPGRERGILVAVWCNGYGGTGCHKAGHEAARWALEGALSADVPEDVFGVARLRSDTPLFDPVRGGPRAPGRLSRR